MSPNLTQPTVVNETKYFEAESGYDEIIDVAFAINKYYLWVILAIGFPGNLATIVTIFRMRSLGSFTLYVVLLAVMDNMAILVKTMIYQLSQINIGISGCRILFFSGNFFATYANWILVLMSVERLVAVRYPLKIQKYLGCKRSAMAICAVGIVIAGAYAPILWIYYYDNENKVCRIEESASQLHNVLHWINVAICVFIPFVALALCNVLIIRVIRESLRVRTALRHIPNMVLKRRASCYDSSIQRQIMLMLFTSTLVFVVFLFPLCTFTVADSYWKVTALTRAYAIKYLYYQLAFVLCDSTHAVNFCLYFLSARKFRTHFIRMSTCASVSSRHASV